LERVQEECRTEFEMHPRLETVEVTRCLDEEKAGDLGQDSLLTQAPRLWSECMSRFLSDY